MKATIVNNYCRFYEHLFVFANSENKRIQETIIKIKCNPCKHADAIIKNHGKEYGLRMISSLAQQSPKDSFWTNVNNYAIKKYSNVSNV